MKQDAAIACAQVCLRSGQVLDGAAHPQRGELASAAAALLRGCVPPALAQAFARFGSEREGTTFQELSFVSAQGAHALLAAEPDVAVVAVSPDPSQLSAVISAAHARRSMLEQKR